MCCRDVAEQSSPRRDPGPIDRHAWRLNRKLIEEFRANRGQLSGNMAGRSLLLLATTGARSRQPRTAVMGFRQDGDRCVVIASGNGAPSHPAWYCNVQANPVARVEAGPEKFDGRASTAGPQGRGRLATLIPYLESQQKHITREIPIVVLRRT
jgi:deazaflavin-dependent oxidoreductase (nitroreductase family)